MGTPPDRVLDIAGLVAVALRGRPGGGMWAMPPPLAHPDGVKRLVRIGRLGYQTRVARADADRRHARRAYPADRKPLPFSSEIWRPDNYGATAKSMTIPSWLQQPRHPAPGFLRARQGSCVAARALSAPDVGTPRPPNGSSPSATACSWRCGTRGPPTPRPLSCSCTVSALRKNHGPARSVT